MTMIWWTSSLAMPRRRSHSEALMLSAVAVAFPDTQMRILPYHRVVKDLNGHTPEALLTVLSQRFPMSAGSSTPSRKGECGVYIRGKWYTLTLGDDVTDAAEVAALCAAWTPVPVPPWPTV